MSVRLTKAWLVAIAIVLSAAVGRTAAAQGLTRIADGVYAYVDAKQASPKTGFGANAGIVVGTNAVLVVDTLVSAKMARAFIKDIRTITDKPVKYVVNTHGHLDHAFGNSEFAKLGAVLVAHRDCRQDMARTGETVLKNVGDFGLSEEDVAGTTIALPVVTFTDGMAIDLGDRIVELMYPGPSHSAGSILVHVPGGKVLFAGDALFTGYHPYLGEGDIESWLRVLDRIAAMDVAQIVPGHGPVSGKKDLADMKEYLAAFDRNARALCAKSDDVERIFSEIKKALPQRAEADFLIKSNIQVKYLKKRND